ncbi:nitroreductase family deazaflavin-dependent oxidoreductase [Saccharopolyspora taberi]|uniref:Nitroreductase family deazaflavin-dependent oxidoreductase n=1 Tax=Saccharopolyspora taberi TaxID=60895 RepID=A0ABN3VII6_9PSEU
MKILALHQKIYQGSSGLVGHRLLGVPTLLLHTTGRRTGRPRTSALVYARDGDRYLVVASAGGADRAPGWFHNLQAEPQVEIRVGRTLRRATARAIWPDDPDYPRNFELVNAVNRDRYRAYAAKTPRPIPIIALTPQT